MDSFSPLAAARVLVQVLPVGPISVDAFNAILRQLSEASNFPLANVGLPHESGRNSFNPGNLPEGKVSFYFSAASRTPLSSMLYPFETFREPFMVLGIADLSTWHLTHDGDAAGGSTSSIDEPLSNLSKLTTQLQESYPSALLHRTLVTARPSPSSLREDIPDVIFVPPGDDAAKKVLCGLAGLLLPELGGLAKSFQALQSYPSPLAAKQGLISDDGSSTNANPGRRGSLQPSSSSQSLNDSKASHRMSMPPHLLHSSSPAAGSRPGTPTQQGRSSPARTFDEMPGAVPPHVVARMATPPGRADASRDSSAERATASGFGSGPLNERNRIKQQGRLACIVGSLYLQAGLWVDALRELADSIAKARSSSDFLWWAKSLENATVCLLLLAWNGIGFRIPDLCYPTSSRPLAALATQTPTEDNPTAPTPEETLEAIKTLYEILPEMIQSVRGLYHRSMEVPGEALPPTAYSEVNIRFARLITGMAVGAHVDPLIQQMMDPGSKKRLPSFRRGRNLIRQASDLLHAALRPPLESLDMPIIERLTILGATTACYSALKMGRKSALILQDYLDTLIPGLVQARKVGAAEAGMHPAAGIANLQDHERGQVTRGPRIEDILKFFEGVQVLSGQDSSSDSSAAISDRATNVDLRLNLLRKCIRVCEALPDFDGILKCTAEVFFLAGPGTALNLRNPEVFIKIALDEQLMLASNFFRTSDLMDNLGLPKTGGKYWDRFLVRGVELQSPSPDREMAARRMSDFGSAATSAKPIARGPFLHDAFAQKAGGAAGQAVLVAGESRSFSVKLQNLFDFEIFIDSLEIVTSMEDFRPRRESIRLNPHRMQTFSISGTPQSAGKVTITGCFVAVKGCEPAAFDIWTEAWSPGEPVKLFNGANRQATTKPKPFALEAVVLTQQPLVQVSNLSLPERAVEVLEGERKKFTLELRNASSTASTNFVRITPQDNVKLYLLSAVKERELSPPLRYELERQLYIEPVLRHLEEGDHQTINPRKSKRLSFEILGKPGLTHMSVVIDYAHLTDEASQNQIFTRVLAIPIAVTVRPSLRLASFSLASLPQDPMGLLAPRESHCWLSMDFQNISSRAIEVSVSHGLPTSDENSEDSQPLKRQSELVPRRSIISSSYAIQKIYVASPYATIPSLDPSKEQQFVVRTSAGAPIDERDERMRFWYNKHLLDSLSATWKDPDSGAHGSISLRDVSLTAADVQQLRLDDISILWSGQARGAVAEVTTLRLRFVNRSQEAVRAELQLYRTISGFVDRVAGGHVESQLLRTIKPQSEVAHEFMVTFECKGHHVFLPTLVEREHAEGAFDRPLRTWHGEAQHVMVT